MIMAIRIKLGPSCKVRTGHSRLRDGVLGAEEMRLDGSALALILGTVLTALKLCHPMWQSLSRTGLLKF